MPSELTESDLETLREWLEVHRDNHTIMPGMDHFPISEDEIGKNISFDELLDIINQTRVEDHWFGPAAESALIIAYSIVMFAGIVCNSLICYVVLKEKTLRTIRNMFIVNLAISDMIMCLFCMPFTLIKLLLKNWVLGDAVCRLMPFLQATNVFGSTITITAIALDRYHVILYPCAGKQRMKIIGAVCFILWIWIASFVVGLPLSIYSKAVEETYFAFVSFTMCIEQWPSKQSRFAYAAIVMVLQFVVPVIVLVSVHWRISQFLKCRINRDPKTQLEMKRALREATRHRKNTSLLMAIAVMYALCWFPLTLLNLLADFNYTMFMYHDFLLAYASAHLIAMTSAIANPIMYGWFNSNFKREFTKFVCSWRRSSQGEPLDDAGNAECRRLVEKYQQNIVYAKPMSYKAIQTEIQPRLPPTRPRDSPPGTTECRLGTGSSSGPEYAHSSPGP